MEAYEALCAAITAIEGSPLYTTKAGLKLTEAGLKLYSEGTTKAGLKELLEFLKVPFIPAPEASVGPYDLFAFQEMLVDGFKKVTTAIEKYEKVFHDIDDVTITLYCQETQIDNWDDLSLKMKTFVARMAESVYVKWKELYYRKDDEEPMEVTIAPWRGNTPPPSLGVPPWMMNIPRSAGPPPFRLPRITIPPLRSRNVRQRTTSEPSMSSSWRGGGETRSGATSSDESLTPLPSQRAPFNPPPLVPPPPPTPSSVGEFWD
jgi:hypothetical protein